jgi:hypothetical protein
MSPAKIAGPASLFPESGACSNGCFVKYKPEIIERIDLLLLGTIQDSILNQPRSFQILRGIMNLVLCGNLMDLSPLVLRTSGIFALTA